ncbi:MAG TPA: hypothetical protein DDZ53_00250 [Firmicutes bacterium]|jgi:hypothetical protein|nr:hypothetical protein [Bacillota bacterium]
MKYKIWDGTDSLITPIGEVLTPAQIKERYPMAGISGMKFVICDSPISMGVFMEFTQTKEHYKNIGVTITDTMTDQEVLDAISYFEENPPEPEPSTEERMAAAMEFQNLLAL